MEKIPNFLWWLQTPLLMKIMFTSVGCCRLYLFGVGLLKNRCVLWEYLLYTAHRLVHGQQQQQERRRWFSSRDDMKNDAAFSLRLDNFQVQPKQVSTSRLTRINFSPATNYLSWKIIPHIIHSNLDIVNKSVRPFLFTILNNSLYQM